MILPLLLLTAATAEGFVDYGNVSPASYALAQGITIDAHNAYAGQDVTLDECNPVLTIDYGTEVAGFAFMDVGTLSAPTQIEVKYAESFVSLENPYSDGPWTFSNGLSDSFRTETLNLTKPGRVQSFFVQGGQRWQTITLLTNTSVTFSRIGFNSTAEHTKSSDVQGHTSTSNTLYNRIWDVGAHVVQVACVDAGNAPSTWEITPDGAYIRGQQTAQSVKGVSFGNYTLSFSTKIVRGGTGWRVAASVVPRGSLFYLTSKYPADNAFENTNRTLLPPNTLVYNYGYSIVNQTTLETGWNEYFPLNITIEEDTWYNISTTITPEGFAVSIDGRQVAFVPITQAALLANAGPSYNGATSVSDGTWGFGPWSEQEAYIKDVSVTAHNGSLLYSNPMTSESVLAEYNVAHLDTSVCLDGGKRDRLVWIGDFYHTGKVIAASTCRFDYVLGSIAYAFSMQKITEPYRGFVPISAYLGTRPEYSDAFLSNYGGLVDYQDLFLLAISNYYWHTGDAKALEKYWQPIKDLVEARMGYIDPYSGLVAGDAFYFLGPANGTTVTALFTSALRSLVPLANTFNDSETATSYTQTAEKLSEAINSKLWNPAIGAYSMSLDAPSNFSATDVAWTILSGTANSSQAESMIAKLPELRLGVGYKTSSGQENSNTTQLSPNTLGMLLDSLFKAHRDLGVSNLTVAKTLLDDFWSKMVTQNEYYSGAAWEYLFPDGSPGIDLFTSLAHPWGAAPTYVLPEYVLGISATSPGFKTWRFEPLLGGLGLTEANGTVITPYGLIQAKWEIVNKGRGAVVTVSVPKGTEGLLVLPEGAEAECDGKRQCGRHVTLPEGKERRVKLRHWQRH